MSLRFLVDNALSPRLADALRDAGHEALHVRDLGMETAPDEEIFAWAASEKHIIVSADTDFGTLLALRDVPSPSVVLFRGSGTRRPDRRRDLLVENLPRVSEDLEEGSLVVFEAADFGSVHCRLSNDGLGFDIDEMLKNVSR